MTRYTYIILKLIIILALAFCPIGVTANTFNRSLGTSNHQVLSINDKSTHNLISSVISNKLDDKFSCSDTIPESKEKFSELVDELFPVWAAVSARDESLLMTYSSSEHLFVSETAWRGLANISVTDVSRLFDLAMNESLDIKWFTLSNQVLDANHLRSLENLISSDKPDVRSGVYLVLGQKGDAISHSFLLSKAETSMDSNSDYYLALAVGRSILSNRESVVPDMLLLKRAMAVTDSKVQAAWMYPWYRSSEVKPSANALDVLGQWTAAYFDKAYGLVRQYMINILGKSAHPSLISMMMDQNLAELHPLEAVELAKALFIYPESDQVAQLRLGLSMHPNPYVSIELLQGIIRMENQPSEAYKNEILSRLTKGINDPFEWLWHVRALGKWWVDDARIILENDTYPWTEHPHYTNDYLETVKSIYTPEDFMALLQRLSQNSDDAILVPVINQISMIAQQSPDDTELRQKVATVLALIAQNNSYRISLAFQVSNSGLDWKSDQSDEYLLNHIQVGETLSAIQPELNVPDANLIKELGSHPIWVLRTNIGDIVMRLDSYRAPATVSTFAGIVNGGWYDGTPFHRVVHNFVIQGGAIWHPDYTNENPFRVPTEGTELEFSRGAVGVASAGRDTETSQFFMMHMWSPHLNGQYSNIGRVIEGEDVIDRLTQGTIVQSSSIYGCY